MKDIRVDAMGRQRCWNCGGLSFTEKRTVRSKVVVGVGAVVTKKKLKCQSCGEFNDVGNAKAYNGPASKRAAKKAGTVQVDAAMQGQLAPNPPQVIVVQQAAAAPEPAPVAAVAATVQPVEELPVLDAVVVAEEPGPLAITPPAPPPPPPPSVPAGWHPDPAGRHEVRYWNGYDWTEHVSNGGVQATDPPGAA